MQETIGRKSILLLHVKEMERIGNSKIVIAYCSLLVLSLHSTCVYYVIVCNLYAVKDTHMVNLCRHITLFLAKTAQNV